MAFNLMRYASDGDLKRLQKWIDNGVHIDAANVRKETALFICSMNGHIKCVEFLLSRGADPNRESLVGMAPLHAAIESDHVKCVGLLLQYGSDLHSTFAEFPTVVAFARYHGNPEVMRLLHAFMVDRGMGHHQPAQNYNAIVMNTCASASCIKITDEDMQGMLCGISTIHLDDIKKPEHKHSFTGPFFSYIDGMWRGSLVTVKHAPEFNNDEFYHFRLRKEINLLRQLRHFRFPVAMAICLDPFCLIMERFYYSTLSLYVRDPNMDMEKEQECHLARIMRIILDVAQALSHLHRKNWIHCHVSSQSILVCDGPRAKLGSLEFCERPGAAVEFMECFQDELPWLAPEMLAVGEARFPADIYGLTATFWECLTRHVPWSWLPENQIPESRQLPIILSWPSLIKHLLSQCLDEADKRPTADDVCRKLGEFMRLGIWLDRCQLDDIFKTWLAEHCRRPSLSRSNRSSVSSGSSVARALGTVCSSLVKNSRRSVTHETYKERCNPQFRRRSAVVTTLVEEALTTLANVGRPPTDVHEADIYKFGFKLARDIAELRGICAIAVQRRRKAWAKVAMATRDLEEDMFDSLAGYEEVTFRRKHAHAANLKKNHQEKEEEKLKESLDRKRSLIKRHKRKNWACYTMLLCELYGILRRRDYISENEENDDVDYEQEAINQSIARLGSQMTKLSSIVFDTMDDNVSGKFSSFPIDMAELARNSDYSVGEDAEDTSNDLDCTTTDGEPMATYFEDTAHDPEQTATDPEHVATDPEHVATDPNNMMIDSAISTTDPEDMVTDPKHMATDSEITATDPEIGATSANFTTSGVDETPGGTDEMEDSDKPTNGSVTLAPDAEASTSFTEYTAPDTELKKDNRLSKSSRIRSFFKRKTKKKAQYMESSV